MDSVSPTIGDRTLDRFLSYRIESNLFTADDAWEVKLAKPGFTANAGDRCEVYVNGTLELTGITDKVSLRSDKDGVKLTLSGRDLMGLLTDSYAEDYRQKTGEKLEALAERLLANVPYINRKDIVYGVGDKSRAVPLTQKEEEFDFTEVEPTKTIFEILKEYALARGMLFFSLPDGKIVFGQPATSGEPAFFIHQKAKSTNVLEGEKTDDISRRYSKVTVMGQRQGDDLFGAEEVNFSATVTDDDFPVKPKPFVAQGTHDGLAPAKYAAILMSRQQFEGFSLTYKTSGHSQNGKNWTVNAVCRVEDDLLDVYGDYLVYERVFEMGRQGVFTTVKLSKLGLLPV